MRSVMIHEMLMFTFLSKSAFDAFFFASFTPVRTLGLSQGYVKPQNETPTTIRNKYMELK